MAATALVDPADFIRDRLRGSSLWLDASYGTLWSGGGELELSGERLGTLSWSFDPTEILRPAIAYDWQVKHDREIIQGRIFVRSPGEVQVTATGRVPNAVANYWLGEYGLNLSGELSLSRSTIVVADRRVQTAAGRISLYRGVIEGMANTLTLPDLSAEFSTPFGYELPCLSAQVWTLDDMQTIVEMKCEHGATRIEVMRRSMDMLDLWFLPDLIIGLLYDSVVCTMLINSNNEIEINRDCVIAGLIVTLLG